jgi:prepilin-type N-terminal cleavage/methylation domain-containing protein
MHFRKAFTLIELLVVIAIIAILAVVVVLTLNPAELLRQARDANRVSDLATINSAINLYNTDQGGASGYSLGVATTSYLSIYDPNATSTLGDQCQGLGIPTSSSYGYQCEASSTYRQPNTTGWMPIAFSSISAGSPFGSLPIDPVNTTSSGDYYAYLPGASSAGTWEIVARLESQKYTALNGAGSSDGGYSGQYAEVGKDLTLALNAGKLLNRVSSTDYLAFDTQGLVGYWPMDEGSGNTSGTSPTADLSGYGDTGIWHGTAAGTNSTYYSAGQVGSWAGMFDGTSTYVDMGNSSALNPTNSLSLAGWVNFSLSPAGEVFFITRDSDLLGRSYDLGRNGGNWELQTGGTNQILYAGTIVAGTWYYVAATGDSINGWKLYINGLLVGTHTWVAPSAGTAPTQIGARTTISIVSQRAYFPGSIDDVRIYNRSLSAAEVQALYNAEK